LPVSHSFGFAVETAYARSSVIEPRRQVMQMWADHLDGGSVETGGHHRLATDAAPIKIAIT
jgi:hypothetical protein